MKSFEEFLTDMAHLRPAALIAFCVGQRLLNDDWFNATEAQQRSMQRLTPDSDFIVKLAKYKQEYVENAGRYNSQELHLQTYQSLVMWEERYYDTIHASVVTDTPRFARFILHLDARRKWRQGLSDIDPDADIWYPMPDEEVIPDYTPDKESTFVFQPSKDQLQSTVQTLKRTDYYKQAVLHYEACKRVLVGESVKVPEYPRIYDWLKYLSLLYGDAAYRFSCEFTRDCNMDKFTASGKKYSKPVSTSRGSESDHAVSTQKQNISVKENELAEDVKKTSKQSAKENKQIEDTKKTVQVSPKENKQTRREKKTTKPLLHEKQESPTCKKDNIKNETANIQQKQKYEQKVAEKKIKVEISLLDSKTMQDHFVKSLRDVASYIESYDKNKEYTAEELKLLSSICSTAQVAVISVSKAVNEKIGSDNE